MDTFPLEVPDLITAMPLQVNRELASQLPEGIASPSTLDASIVGNDCCHSPDWLSYPVLLVLHVKLASVKFKMQTLLAPSGSGMGCTGAGGCAFAGAGADMTLFLFYWLHIQNIRGRLVHMQMFAKTLKQWLGVSMASLRVVYAFRGDTSMDTHAGCVEHWTQRHNPFLGKDAPPTFMQGWAEWHALMFDDGTPSGAELASDVLFAVGGDDGACGVVFVVERGLTTASAYLRQMAIELGLAHTDIWETVVPFSEFAIDGYSNSPEHGYDAHAGETTAVFLKLPPNSYREAHPFKCCDIHAMVCKLAASPTPEAAIVLQDVFLCSTHLAAHEIDTAFLKLSRRHGRSVGLQTLRMGFKSCMVVSSSSHWKRNLHAVFGCFQPVVIREFFACQRSTLRLLRFFERWNRWDSSPGVPHATMLTVLQKVVPEPLKLDVLLVFREHCADSFSGFVNDAIWLYHEVLQKTVSTVLRPAGCSFVKYRVLEYLRGHLEYNGGAKKRRILYSR